MILTIMTQLQLELTSWAKELQSLPMLDTVFTFLMRYLLLLLAAVIVVRSAISLLRFRRQPEIWAWVTLPTGDRLPVTHWENIIGRGKRCDIQVEYPTISRTHAVLTRYDDGSWTIGDAGSKGGVMVNGQEITVAALEFGDVFTLGGVEFTLVPITQEQEIEQAERRSEQTYFVQPGLSLGFLTLFQIFLMVSLVLHKDVSHAPTIFGTFFGLIATQWGLFWLQKLAHRKGYDLEVLAFFLTTLGFSIIASSTPAELPKQLFALWLGLAVFLVVGWSLRDLERAKLVRYFATGAGLLLLTGNLVFGTEINGAKNWIYIGSLSFQPSELVKICFIFAGTSTLDRLVSKRNIVLFLLYSGAICLCLALMNDFGTALVFFVAFLVICYLRSGDFATLSLICAGTGFAGVLVLRFRPYILNRFSAWGHVWENALTTGYQQTRAMMCIAAGGLLGLGAGNGWLRYVAASDTDLVFAFIAEELGLLMALFSVLSVVCICAFIVRSAPVGRSCFHTIGACAAGTILLMQMLLNVFGTIDFLPLTGVTFPFVSNGGSSMLSSWGLLAFIKACDTRQNASFAIRLPGQRR